MSRPSGNIVGSMGAHLYITSALFTPTLDLHLILIIEWFKFNRYISITKRTGGKDYFTLLM